MPPKPEFIPNIRKLSEVPPDKTITMLLYGITGAGKTFFCGTAGPRTLFINIGHGLTTLQSPAFLEKHPYDPWFVNVPIDVDQMDYVTGTIDYAVKNKRGDFDTIVIDDCSALGRIAMQKAIEVNEDLQKTKTNQQAKAHGGLISPNVADYGEEINVLTWFLSTYTEMAKIHEYHFICTAHERQVFGKAPKIGDARPLTKIRPGFTGETFPDKIPAFFDEVWQFEVVGSGEKKKFRQRTVGNELINAKSRHGGIFKEIEEGLTFPEVVKRIQSYKYVPSEADPSLLVAVK